MILPIDTRAAPCFARQSGLRIETRACSADCTRPCARNRRALAALLGARGSGPCETDATSARESATSLETSMRTWTGRGGVR